MGKPRSGDLTLKERRFVDAYLGSAAGNATKAAQYAGYAVSSSDVTASRLLGKARIRAVIDRRQAALEEKGIASAEERDLLLSRVIRDETIDVAHRINAIKELNRCTGRHSIKHLHKARLTLEEALERSMQPRP
jgi:phage terminase small subunit